MWHVVHAGNCSPAPPLERCSVTVPEDIIWFELNIKMLNTVVPVKSSGSLIVNISNEPPDPWLVQWGSQILNWSLRLIKRLCMVTPKRLWVTSKWKRFVSLRKIVHFLSGMLGNISSFTLQSVCIVQCLLCLKPGSVLIRRLEVIRGAVARRLSGFGWMIEY